MGHFHFLEITLHSLSLYLLVQKPCSSKEEFCYLYFPALPKCGLERHDEIVPSAVGHVGDTAPFPLWWVGEDLQEEVTSQLRLEMHADQSHCIYKLYEAGNLEDGRGRES